MPDLDSKLTAHRSNPANRAALVFVHGFLGDAATTWQKFPGLLQQEPKLDGWDVLSLGYATNLRLDLAGIWSADPPIDRVSKLLGTHIISGELRRYESLGILAHSMGGLAVQRAVLDEQQARARVGHVFLFGTPSGGLMKASLASFFKRQLRDMSHGGPFIQDLRTRWEQAFGAMDHQHPFKLTVATGERDEFVPPESSLAPFPSERFPDVTLAVVPGNHLQIVKPEKLDDLSVRLVVNTLAGSSAPAGQWNSAYVAVEQRRFQSAIDTLEPHKAELDAAGLVQLALALEGVGRGKEALDLLETQGSNDTDAMGVLAGRIKRRWVNQHLEADARKARELYASAYDTSVGRKDWAQAYYHGINVAFFDLAWKKDQSAAEAMAKRVLVHCADAKAGELPKDSKWRLATGRGEPLAARRRHRRGAVPERAGG